MKLYILGPSAVQVNTQPDYFLYVTKDDKLLYLGNGPRFVVEFLIRAFKFIYNSEINEFRDVSSDTFVRIMRSAGFEFIEK